MDTDLDEEKVEERDKALERMQLVITVTTLILALIMAVLALME